MHRFSYVAQDVRGEEHRGELNAGSYNDLVAKLDAQGLFLTSYDQLADQEPTPAPKKVAAPARAAVTAAPAATPKKVTAPATPAKPKPAAAAAKGGKMSRKDMSFFFRQLHFQYVSGISLLEALQNIQMQTDKPAVVAMVNQLATEIHAGQAFSTALEKFSSSIPPLILSMVYAGEQSGQLGKCFERIEEYLEKQGDLVHQVRSLLIYPAFIVLTAFTTMFLMSAFILPSFVEIFKQNDKELPSLTEAIIDVSGFMNDYRWGLVGLFFVLGAVIVHCWKQSGKNMTVDSLVLKIPVFKEVMARMIWTRYANTLSLLLDSGIDILKAMLITKKAVGNMKVGSYVQQIHDDLKKGKSLSAAMTRITFFPSLMVSMIATGEKSGRLPPTLDLMNIYYEKELTLALRDFFSMVEPLIILIMGAVIGTLAVGLLLPIFDMSSVVG